MFTSADTPPSETGHSEVAYSTGTAFDRPLRDDATRSMTSFPFSKMLMQPNPYMQAPIKIVHQPHLPSHLQAPLGSLHNNLSPYVGAQMTPAMAWQVGPTSSPWMWPTHFGMRAQETSPYAGMFDFSRGLSMFCHDAQQQVPNTNVADKSKAQVHCRNLSKTGCTGQARTLGGVGKHHYAYYCTLCRDSWAQLRPSAIGPDGDLRIRETKRKAPPLPASTKKQKALSSNGDPDTDSSFCLHSSVDTEKLGTDDERCVNSKQDDDDSASDACKSSGLTVTEAQVIISQLEGQVFGSTREGDMKQRLSALEEELGLPPSDPGATIIARMDRIRG
ncbi:hypothetical protein AB1Y20_000435 [Prymnesium parvum]|uniref:Uncharacterized protein n=1 Tax=Prymnesium parvum TaxID=97485 RepID=A0AB34K6E7_PRYPA